MATCSGSRRYLPSSGEKKRATKKKNATVRAVRPVRPPSRMPEADSMKHVTGEVPRSAPTTLDTPSTLNAIQDRSNVCKPHPGLQVMLQMLGLGVWGLGLALR